MRLVSISNCGAGMVIGKPIFTDSGNVLIGVGVSLTQRMIDSLSARNVKMVYIKDRDTEDLLIRDDIPLELRIEAMNTITDTFNVMRSSNQKWQKITDNINAEKLLKVFKALISEIRGAKNVINLLTNVQVHDNYIFAHSTNVTIYTLAMAVKLGFDDKKLSEIGIGGMLHDIGKTMVPLEILNKQTKLTDQEFDLIKKHTEYGFESLRNQSSISLLSAHCAFQHHEKMDGSGYPRKLKGDEIHPYAKIMAVADVFDALTAHRAYRKAMLPHEAMEIIYAGANTHFEADLINTFQKSVASYPVGITVKLNTGETAVVADYKFHSPGRPVVRVLKDPYGQPLPSPYEIDLSRNLSIMITNCDAIM